MCLGIPLQVVAPEGEGGAWCVGRGGRQLVDLTLVGAQPPGTWLLTFLGSAREVMTAEAARQTELALDALEGVLAGDASRIEAAFADITGREPQLPPHLRPAKDPAA